MAFRFHWPWTRGGSAGPPRAVVPAPAAGEFIELGGRRFVPAIARTLAHDTWYMGLVHRNGLDELVQGDQESQGDYGVRVLGVLLASGCIWDLVGGMLLPDGMDHRAWTPAVAAETAAFIGSLDDPAEKERAYPIAMECWLRFFVKGRRSSPSSPPSSAEGPDLSALLDRMTLSASGAR